MTGKIRMWALAYSQSDGGKPLITPMVEPRRTDIVGIVEECICGKGNWRKWSRQTGAKIIKVTVSEGWDHD